MFNEKSVLMNIVHNFGTPVYAYDADCIMANYHRLQSALSKPSLLFYSMKANPTLAICQLLAKQGAGCEVCTTMELAVALKAGFSPDKIIFLGPAKSLTDLNLCLDKKIFACVCESLQELAAYNELSQSKGFIAPVLLRINPNFQLNQSAYKMSGVATQFGMDSHLLDQIDPSHYPALRFKGIHIYNGTQVLQAKAITDNMQAIIDLSQLISKNWSIDFDFIGLGGGFGIPYFDQEQELPVNDIFNALKRPEHRTILVESGRYLLGNAGVLIGQIMDMKESHGKSYVITDMGMHCGFYATRAGALFHRHYPIEVITKKESQQNKLYTITGPSCTPSDTLAQDLLLPDSLQIGDYVIIKQMGAYGLTASPGRFLSHGYPAEVLYYQGQARLIRRRENETDILATQISL